MQFHERISIFPICGSLGRQVANGDASIFFRVDITTLCCLDAYSGGISQFNKIWDWILGISVQSVIVELQVFSILP